MTGIPYAPTVWDEIIPGLSMGGHYTLQPDGLYTVVVADEFDVVFSLYSRAGHGPTEGVEHHVAKIEDSPYLPEHERQTVRDLADKAAEALEAGRTVLVRCQAGYNRSGLLVAFILLRQGWAPTKAVDEIQARRSPHALSNEHFVRLVFGEAARLARKPIEAFS